MATDTSGQQAVDFVWGNFPMQPNNDRAAAITPANIGGGAGDYSWSATTRVASDRLNPALSNHAVAEAAYAGYPGFTGNDDGAYVSGVAYIVVPSVLGDTTAVALDELKDAGYEAANITTATAATNVAGSITDIDRTAGSTTVRLTGTGFTAAYPVGTKITVASTGTVDGTWTVTANESTDKIFFVSSASTVLTTGTGSIIGVAGTIKSQSTAAGAASVATTATITITPWAAAS
jgi:hypothetical protein